MKITIKLFLLLITVAVATLTHAQPGLEKIDSLFRLLEKHNKFMGSAAMMKDGRLIYNQAFGFADVGQNIPASTNTSYRIGSISKTFTAVMVLQMVDEGKLSLDDPLEKYFPGIEGASRISLEQMLRHRSGLFSLTSDSAYKGFYTQPQSRQQLLNRIKEYRLQFAPDEKMEYSNTNYLLLGWLLEDLSGMSYDKLLQQKIAEPLGLKHTFVVNPAKDREVVSYSWDGTQWKVVPFTDLSIPGGAGNIYSTAEELMTFYHALFNGRLISEASFSRMTQFRNNFGMGVFAMPFYEHKGLGHTGGIDGFRSVAVYYAEEKVGAAVCANALNYNQNDILIAILNEVFGKDWKLPDINEAKIDVAILASYAGTYAAEGFPLKLTIRQREGKLYGQGTGQPEFPLEACSEDTFVFDNAGLSITFKDGKLHLKQGAIKLEMSKEE